MKSFELKRVQITDDASFDYKQTLISIIGSYVVSGINYKDVATILDIMRILNDKNMIILITNEQWSTIKSAVESFNGWKFVHPCIIEFCNDIINAPDFKE